MYYAVVSKNEEYLMKKAEWVEFLKTHKGFSARKFKIKADAESILNQNKQRRELKSKETSSLDKYKCFYDSEFNAYDYDNGKPQEVVSIGLVIMDQTNGQFVDTYYSTIRLKASKLTKRCKSITGLTEDELKNSPSFYVVCKEIYKFIKDYNIDKIYALGQDDLKQFEETSKLYNRAKEIQDIAKKIVNIRKQFRSLTNQEIGDMGLKYLKQICNIKGAVEHNALQDAKDLANVDYVLRTVGYSDEHYQNIIKLRKEERLYEKSRNVQNEKVYAPKEIVDARNQLVRFLKSGNNGSLDPIIMKAMIDDLESLIVLEN